jgi:hypothetical protein
MLPSLRYDTRQDTCMGTVGSPMHISQKTMKYHSRNMTVLHYQMLNETVSTGILIVNLDIVVFPGLLILSP